MIQKILQLKDKGFVPDVVILEWTQCVVLAGIVRSIFRMYIWLHLNMM